MKSQQTFFIVPGFKQQATDKSYSYLVSFLESKNFKVVLVPIKWDRRVMSDYISDFKKYYQKNKAKTNYVLGFSYGAVITFSSASDLLPDKIFLCSLSPDFKEDILTMKPWMLDYVGKNRINDSRMRSGIDIAKNLKIPSVIFYGEKEGRQYPQLKIRCEETVKLAKNSKLIVVRESPHQIDNPEYKKSVLKELQQL